MKPDDISDRLRDFPLYLPTALLCLLVALSVIGVASGEAQSAQEEREFKKSFKDKGNKNWLRELEIEVKNTGSKPIYYLYVVITMPEIIRQGHPLGYRVTYGRRDLLFLDTPVKPDDVSIPPGGSVTLRIPESRVGAYEKTRDAEKRAEPKKVEFDLQFINFGDGTGLEGTDGSPAARPPQKVSANKSCLKEQDSLKDVTAPPGSFTERYHSFLPANFSRVNFFTPTGTM
jgi:hypothetical protein